MAKTKKTEKTTDNPETNTTNRFSISRQNKIAIGVLLVLLSVALGVSFISYFVSGTLDQSQLQDIGNRN